MYRGVACHGVAMVVGRAVRRYWTLLLLLEWSHRTVPSRSHAHRLCQLLSAVIRLQTDARCKMQDVEHLLSTDSAILVLATSHPPLVSLQKLAAILCIDWLWTLDGAQRRAIFWGAVVVWMTVCQLFYSDLFISIKEYMTLIIYLFLASPRAYSSDRLYS